MNAWCLLLVCMGVSMVEAGELSPFRLKKIRQHFWMADRNGDKNLQMIDYKLIADNVLQIEGYDKYNASYIYDVLVFKAWQAFPNKDSTLKMTEDEIANTGPAILKQGLDALTEIMYDVWDCRKPYGCLSAEELEYELGNLGKTQDLEQQGKAALKAIDANKDGCATLAEYQTAALCYFASENPADECTQFLGILDEY